MSEDLKPCAHCNGNNIKIYYCRPSHEWSVRCVDCQYSKSSEEAIEKWNKRA